jgi:two-component system, NarL family, nitrate/nitrite response regulator NarL
MLNDPNPRRNIRVLVADGSHIHSHLLADALMRDPLLEAIPFDSDSTSLVGAVTGLDIDVLVISAVVDEQPTRGLELLRELRAVRPGLHAVVLLDSLKDDAVLSAFRAGARGIFGKSQPIDVLSKCVRRVHEGQIWANSHELALAVEALANSPTVRAVNARGMGLLSKRELQVVRCLAEGMTNREIAQRLDLSQHTVKNYLFRIYDKLGASSRVEVLFMTLSHAGPVSPAAPDPINGSDQATGTDEFAALQKGAEAGLPVAQLALAQLYLVRSSDPQDLVHAYKWYVIAMERSSQARGLIAEMMTAPQIEEAQQEARAWLARAKGTSTSSLKGDRAPDRMAAINASADPNAKKRFGHLKP